MRPADAGRIAGARFDRGGAEHVAAVTAGVIGARECGRGRGFDLGEGVGELLRRAVTQPPVRRVGGAAGDVHVVTPRSEVTTVGGGVGGDVERGEDPGACPGGVDLVVGSVDDVNDLVAVGQVVDGGVVR